MAPRTLRADSDVRTVAAAALFESGTIRAALAEGVTRAGAEHAFMAALELGLGSPGVTRREMLKVSYRWLVRASRNHSVYQTAAVRRFPLTKSRSLMPEFGVGVSIADLAIASGDLHLVEIKSDLDDLSRLSSQLRDYRTVAARVTVAAPAATVARLARDSALESIGLMELSSRGRLVDWRPALRDDSLLSPVAMLSSLRRAEYLHLLRSFGFELDDLPNTRVFKEAIAIAGTLEPTEVQSRMAGILARRAPRAGARVIRSLPIEWCAQLLRIDPRPDAAGRLGAWLNGEVNDVLT